MSEVLKSLEDGSWGSGIRRQNPPELVRKGRPSKIAGHIARMSNPKNIGEWFIVQEAAPNANAAAQYKKAGCEVTTRHTNSGYDIYARWPNPAKDEVEI